MELETAAAAAAAARTCSRSIIPPASTRDLIRSSSFDYCSTMGISLSRQRISVILAAIVFGFLLLVAYCTDFEYNRFSMKIDPALSSGRSYALSLSPHRKLLNRESSSVDEPTRIWGEKKCSKSDVLIYQGPTDPLPNGIPTYTVEIMNACITTGCHISHIHLRCGWFSSARLIDPRIFKRLNYNDCLVNGGKPLTNGDSISFQYANTFPYHLSVSSMVC